MKKHIPNIITMLNLFSGCIAITMAFFGNFEGVLLWVIAAAIFDFFDGFAARLLHVSSPMGKELDSLADVISFGLAPSAAVYILLRDFVIYPHFLAPLSLYLPYFAFLIAVFSALRLAKFNLDERQTSYFIGMPTPANALFWISYCCGIFNLSFLENHLLYITLILIVAFSLLMISEIPMFSLKIKKLALKGNEMQALLIASMIVFVLLLDILGIAAGIVAYIALSFFGYVREKKKTE